MIHLILNRFVLHGSQDECYFGDRRLKDIKATGKRCVLILFSQTNHSAVSYRLVDMIKTSPAADAVQTEVT